MKHFSIFVIFYAILLQSSLALAAAVVMNPGKAIGQFTVLTVQDVLEETPKYKALNPLSIPVFAELPLDLSVVAGVITLKQQNLLSHVQIKSRARKTPNLDISQLQDGLNNSLFSAYTDGDYIELILTADGPIEINPSTEAAAKEFYKNKKNAVVELKADLSVNELLPMSSLTWLDYDKVGSKAANYAELAHALNTPERTVVRTSMAIPFSYYKQFLDQNPTVSALIKRVSRDPLMKRVTATEYREKKLSALTDLIFSDETVIDDSLLNELLTQLDTFKNNDNIPRKMKLRSSTNAEDLPNFNGAGLYTSKSYKPAKGGKEKSNKKKKSALIKALKTVWSSIWNLRAFDERNYFSIPHDQVYMGVQINPSFKNEQVDGVVVTTNIAGNESLTGDAVYIEAQRGDFHSVANPEAGVKPEKLLVLYNKSEPLNKSFYKINVIQRSNISDDMETILPIDNITPVMLDNEILDLVYQSLKAVAHFKPILSKEGDSFSLDIEFKVDKEDTGNRQVYLKQARPFIE